MKRRGLPKGAKITDYEFLEGPASLADGDEPVTRVRLSQLFTDASLDYGTKVQVAKRAQ